MNIELTPYANLDPNLILNAVENLSLRCDGTLAQLNSFENRVYQIGIEDEQPLIAKFYRPLRWRDEAILEEHAFALALAALEIPIVPPLVINGHSLHSFQGYRFALFPRQGGRALELDNLEQLEWMGRFIGRLHAVGASDRFHHRLTLNTKTYGEQPREFLLEHDFIPLELTSQYQDLTRRLLDQINEIFTQLQYIPMIRLHGDCHAGNVLWRDSGPHIVDLDDCLMGPTVQDIWMLLSGNNNIDFKQQLKTILRGYNTFHDFDRSEIKLIEPLRTMRMIHYTGWLARRWDDPAFPMNFPWFNTIRYWQEHIILLQEQIVRLNEEN